MEGQLDENRRQKIEIALRRTNSYPDENHHNHARAGAHAWILYAKIEAPKYAQGVIYGHSCNFFLRCKLFFITNYDEFLN